MCRKSRVKTKDFDKYMHEPHVQHNQGLLGEARS